MKILLINNVHYERGGADVVYLNTGKLLESKQNDVIYFSTNNKKNTISGVSDYFVKYDPPLKESVLKQLSAIPKKFYSFESKARLKRLINKEKPDIAHVHLYKGWLTSSILTVLHKNKIPAILTVHSYSMICANNTLYNSKNEICTLCLKGTDFNCVYTKCNRNSFIYSFLSYLEHIFIKKAFNPGKYFKKVICVSKFNLDFHIQYSGVNHQKLLHLYNFSQSLTDNIPSITRGDYYLFYGRIERNKGILNLLHVFKNIDEKLKVVGNGDALNEVLALRSNNIEVLGYKSGQELISLIKNACFIIVPSEWYENNPMTIVESYSLGKPVIGSKVGGIPEIIKEGITGFLFEMGNVEDLKSKIDLAKGLSEQEYIQLCNNAHNYALLNFSKENHYKELMKIYKSVLD